MKNLIIIIAALLMISCGSVEQRIKEHSYTDEWYYIDTMRFQVYKTKSGRKYIIVLNEKHTKYKRYYIEQRKCKSLLEYFNFVFWDDDKKL